MDEDITSYYLRTFARRGEDTAWLAEHLLALMRARHYEVVSEVRITPVPALLVPWPDGFVMLHAEVDVREFDTVIGP